MSTVTMTDFNGNSHVEVIPCVNATDVTSALEKVSADLKRQFIAGSDINRAVQIRIDIKKW